MDSNKRERPALRIVTSLQEPPQPVDIELRCLREGCGAVLLPGQAYFCSQRCLDLYEEPDVASFTDEAWATYWAGYHARMLRADQIRQASLAE
jgi:hypothetical protein